MLALRLTLPFTLSLALTAALAFRTAAPAGPQAAPPPKKRPLVVAHRGASGLRPEHTLAAYELAIAQGADYIEPDLVSTKDGVLVARHENEISGTTDVGGRPEFAGRKTTKTIDGREVTGWFTEDFTLAELKTLRAKERIPDLRPESARHDGKFQVPTFQEVIDLAKRKRREMGRVIGVYPETKHPSYFESVGLPLEKPLVEALKKNGWTGADAPVFIQSFEVGNLKQLRKLTKVRLAQLVGASGQPYDFTARKDRRTYRDLLTPDGLKEIAAYADGLGAEKALVIPRNPDDTLGQPTTLVRDAHAAGLVVHAWTFRAENVFLPKDLRKGKEGEPAYPRTHGDFAGEVRRFAATGIDGLFSDYPGAAVGALTENGENGS